MLFSTVFKFLLLAVPVFCFPSKELIAKPEIVPLTTQGHVAAVHGANEDTRLFYQDANGNIQQLAVDGPFEGGHSESTVLIAPAAQVKSGTPIAAVATGTDLTVIHLFFFSPSNVLSEYIWGPTGEAGWQGGPSCAQCITTNGFVATGSSVLYAMVDESTGILRAGFVSAGNPSTLSEADNLGSGWAIAQLPNFT